MENLSGADGVVSESSSSSIDFIKEILASAKNELAEFNLSIYADVQRDTDGSGETDLERDAFFYLMTERLEAVGEIETSERAYVDVVVSNKTIRVDGSGGDPRDTDGVLSLIVSEFHGSELKTINAQDAKRIFGYLRNFITSSWKSDFRTSLPTGSPVAGLASMIADAWGATTKIKLIYVTNANYSARTDAVTAGEIGGAPATYNVWDLSRFYRYENSLQAREVLNINFRDTFGGSIPALAASKDGGELDSYLMVIPGIQLADIYDKWGARLLESNVRSFLQAKGKVNKSIRDTINTDPALFFSYNNGLSATADSLELESSELGGTQVVSIKNLQIVNGGQTTASIHAAKRINPDALKEVYVQMKLTVVPPARAEELVPKISEFANSQNKVSAADFFSNHPFHIRMEDYSRRTITPVESESRDTKWFYERARGQYLVERAKRSDAERRRFDIEYPKNQFFTKTDLAKAEFSFQALPHIVSKGAQKNFADFAKDIGAQWLKGDGAFDELWYKRLIAKLIIFRHMEKLVPRQEWYPGGYRANIVTYAVSKLSSDVAEKGLAIDLDSVWRSHSVSSDLEGALLFTAKFATAVIMHPVHGLTNISEWAKKQACWETLRTTAVAYGSPLAGCTVTLAELRSAEQEQKREATMISGIEAQSQVISLGGEYWGRLRAWARDKALISIKEDGILRACTVIPNRLPSEKQCIFALRTLEKYRSIGYRDEDEPHRIKINKWIRDH